MYLSRVTLKPSCNMASTLLKLQSNGVYASHQILWQLFTHEEERQFIYREEVSAAGLPVFYVLSHHEPERQSELFQVEVKPFLPALVEGQRLAFKLRANPTICVTENGKSKRHDVLMHAKKTQKANFQSGDEIKRCMDQAAQSWLSNEKRLAQWGITLENLPDIEAYTQHRSKKKSGKLVQFSSVDFQGILRIVDPDKFLSQYKNGFGRAKSMGCGLMLIRPV